MSNYSEFTKKTCAYSSLGNTWSQKVAPDVVTANAFSYTVPEYCPDGAGPNYPPALDTLSHGHAGSYGGYFQLTSAYPYATCDTCKTSFTDRPCIGSINCAKSTPTPAPAPESVAPVAPAPVAPAPTTAGVSEQGLQAVEGYYRHRYGRY